MTTGNGLDIFTGAPYNAGMSCPRLGYDKVGG